MNREQKATEIARLLKDENYRNSFLLSCIIISYCISELDKKGILESPEELSERGKNIAVLCQEFAWQPTDKEIYDYCEMQMANNTKEEREKFFTIIKVALAEEILT